MTQLTFGCSLRYRATASRVLAVALHTQRKGLHALEEEERVERADRRPGVPQTLHAGLDDVGDVRAKVFLGEDIGVDQAVIALVWLGEAGELARPLPVELATVNNHAADGGAVAADELGQGLHDDVGAVIEWSHQVRAGKGVVDD